MFFFGVFFKTAKRTLDHAYNEQTETVQEYSWDILISRIMSVYENKYNFRCNFNPFLIDLERYFKNWEKAEYLLIPAVIILQGFPFLSPEIDAGADEKQSIYFYWP